MPISSLQVEKHTLAGIIKYPNVFADVNPFLKETDFFDKVHETIFLVAKSLFEKGEKWDKVLLAEKIKNIGISFKNEINIYDYIDNLSFITITPQATIDSAKELIKIRIRRDLEAMGQEVITFVNSKGNAALEEIILGVDSIFGKKIDILEQENQPQNLFENIEEMVEERGNKPIEETGLITPHKEFNRMYGGLKSGHVYAFASRPAQGKSSWLEDLAIKTCIENDTKAFVCDTEMSTDEIRWRTIAAISSVPEWFLETGKFRKNEEMTKKVRSVWGKIKEFKEKNYVTHYHVGNKNLNQIISVIRRWHAKNIKPGQASIIVYDYLKLTSSENIKQNWAEYQVMGEKIDRLKRLAEELNCVLLTAIQLNRSGERRDGELVDDSSAIAISDRLQWFAAFVAILRRKTPDEYTRDGERFGTHKMIPLKTRFQGKDASGHLDYIRRRNEEGDEIWTTNFLNYNINNFNVEERGSLRDIVTAENNQFAPSDQNPNDCPTL